MARERTTHAGAGRDPRDRSGQRSSGARSTGRGGAGPRAGGSRPAAPDRPTHERAAHARELRIIGGMWRGRRFRFPQSPEIRPTPDRVRETLFNWLAGRVSGARCLDLFAGSGALGLEALSRGAAEVVFVERDAAAARELGGRLAEWGAAGARVEHRDALRFLHGVPQPFDIVFLDPPFAAAELLPATLGLLEGRQWLAPGALIYIECAARGGLPALPGAWTVVKAKRAGEVGYHLAARRVQAAGAEVE